VFQTFIDIDSVQNSHANEREKPIHLRKLETLVRSKVVPPEILPTIFAFCLSLYAENYAPLWGEVLKSLTIFGELESDIFWSEYHDALKKLESYLGPATVTLHNGTKGLEPVDKPNRKFKPIVSFECTHINDVELRWSAIENGLFGEAYLFGNFVNDCFPSFDHFDHTNCFTLTIKTLANLPQISLEKSAWIVPHFFTIVSRDLEDVTAVDEGEEDIVGSTKNARLKILAYLSVFSKVKRPRKFFQSQKIFEHLLHLLSNGDARLQKAALDCILTWQYQGIVKFQDLIVGLADDERIRDSIAVLDMPEFRDSVPIEHQQVVIDVICRILYGKIISRKGRGSSKSGNKARRTAIFGFLSTFTETERAPMVSLMLEPFRGVIANHSSEFKLKKNLSLLSIAPIKTQLGFLNVLEDFVQQTQSLLVPSIPDILSVLIHLVHYAEEFVSQQTEPSMSQQARQVRLLTLKRLNQIYSLECQFDFTPYIPQQFESFIDARIAKLETENTQAPSAILELFTIWSKQPRFIPYLVNYNNMLLTNLLRLMSATKVQDSVISCVIRIFENIQDVHELQPDSAILPGLIDGRMGLLLNQCEFVLDRIFSSSSKNLRLVGDSIASRIIRMISRFAVFVENGTIAEKLVTILLPFLKSPVKQVPETTKTEILQIFCHFLPLLPSLRESHPYHSTFWPILSQLFFLLSTKAARTQLVEVFQNLASIHDNMKTVVALVDDLNAWSSKRIEEPDFERRFDAYSKVNQELWSSLDVHEWLPVLYNFFFFVNDPEEYSIRTSAAYGIERFIERTAQLPSLGTETDEPLQNQMIHVVFPQIKKGIRQASEVSRQELVLLLGKLVKTHQHLPQFGDMACLLGIPGDDETNFFLNIVHLQSHRRIKALRHLSQCCHDQKLSASNISNIFVSMCAQFIFESNKHQDHTLINEALAAIQACVGALPWSQYYSCLKRFMNSLQFRPELEKTIIRLIVLILDQFHFQMEVHDMIDLQENSKDVEDDDAEMELEQEAAELVVQKELELRIHEVVTKKLLPTLQKMIAVEDDEKIPIRIPLAIAVTKLLKKLPQRSMEIHLPKLLLTLANILTSHLQSTRDSARTTLATISVMLDPHYLPYILRSLRTSLKRGYQLHVLAYTVHAIMEEAIKHFKTQSVDASAVMIVEIAIQDIFGESAKEREVQELRNKMREIRTTKSYETLEYLARLVSFGYIQQMIQPVKDLMYQTNQVDVVKRMEEVFKRLAVGLNSNDAVEHLNLMVFCQKLLSESLPLAQPDKQKNRKLSDQERHVKVDLKRDSVFTVNYYEANVHLFIEFGLSILLHRIKLEKLNSREKEHLEMMDPLVPLLGKGLYAKHVSVSILSLRIFALILKWPLPQLNDAIPVMINRMFQLIAKSGTTDSELVQTIFKVLAIIIRDLDNVELPEKRIIALMEKLGADIEEPDRQTTTFSLIKAILSRRIVCTEVYDLMDKISHVLVTNQAAPVREMCRHVFIQFLVDYPHGHIRLRKIVTYLISNLEYEFESGRNSVLELLFLGISKFSNEVFSEYAEFIFLGLVMVLANDQSPKCKEMSAVLIKMLLQRLEVTRMDKPLLLIQKWYQSPKLRQVALQVSGIIIEAFDQVAKPWVINWIPKIFEAVSECNTTWQQTDEDDELEWEHGYMALKTMLKVAKSYTDILLFVDGSETTWNVIVSLQLHPHHWIRFSCAQLLGCLYAHVDPLTRCLAGTIATQHPTFLCPILQDEQMVRLNAKRCTIMIDSDQLTPELSKQIIKNLLFLSKCLLGYVKDGLPTTPSVHWENEDDNELQSDEELPPSEVDITRTSLYWICRRLAYMARSDATKRPKQLLPVLFIHVAPSSILLFWSDIQIRSKYESLRFSLYSHFIGRSE
jgi:U3 small nucleolar RNA-associated protein 20